MTKWENIARGVLDGRRIRLERFTLTDSAQTVKELFAQKEGHKIIIYEVANRPNRVDTKKFPKQTMYILPSINDERIFADLLDEVRCNYYQNTINKTR